MRMANFIEGVGLIAVAWVAARALLFACDAIVYRRQRRLRMDQFPEVSMNKDPHGEIPADAAGTKHQANADMLKTLGPAQTGPSAEFLRGAIEAYNYTAFTLCARSSTACGGCEVCRFVAQMVDAEEERLAALPPSPEPYAALRECVAVMEMALAYIKPLNHVHTPSGILYVSRVEVTLDAAERALEGR